MRTTMPTLSFGWSNSNRWLPRPSLDPCHMSYALDCLLVGGLLQRANKQTRVASGLTGGNLGTLCLPQIGMYVFTSTANVKHIP
jgi:hypothetical protein